MTKLRVQFIHGLEGSPSGTKARTLAAHFESVTPAMDTSDFEACVALHAEKVRRFEPDVLVASSFGGAVAVALLQREHWRGPTLLLAQAALRQGLRAKLPAGVPIWLVHARAEREGVAIAQPERKHDRADQHGVDGEHEEHGPERRLLEERRHEALEAPDRRVFR